MNFFSKLALCWRILRVKHSNLIDHAKRELPTPKEDDLQELMNHQLLEIITVFSTHRHSGSSASYATSLLEKLLRYEPLRPLTGNDDEWIKVGNNLFQNKRAGHVFKDETGAYDSEGIVFRDPNGSCWLSNESRVSIIFPYMPTKVYVDRP